MDLPYECGVPRHERVAQLDPELIAAVMDNDVAKLQSLREAGASLSVVDEEGNTLLQQSIHHKKAEVFDYLLSFEDAPLDQYYDYVSPILATFYYATEDFALKLIERGCSLDDTDTDENTLLHCAVLHRWIRVVGKLIEKGADVNCRNERGETSLFLACQDHMVDEVFLLLHHGANPSIKNYWKDSCLDVLAKHNDDKVQDFFLNTLYPRYKILNLTTVIEVMARGSVTFPKLLNSTMRIISVDHYSLQLLAERIEEYDTKYFKLFIDKFTYIVEKVTQTFSVAAYFLHACKHELQKYVENVCTMFGHHKLGPHIVDKIKTENFPVVSYIITIFKEHGGEIEALTKLVCCLLSHGVYLYQDDLYEIFTMYGYCELFKIMLHMDIKVNVYGHRPILPAIIYDVNLTLKQYLQRPPNRKAINLLWKLHRYDDINTLCILLDYFALPELKKYCMTLHNEKLTARVQQLPSVPSLVELARNSARSFIVYRYKTRNSRQFYTVLAALPIAQVYKQILAFEKKLYV